MTGQACSICHWSKRCYGCPIEPDFSADDSSFRKLLEHSFIACEWDYSFFRDEDDPQSSSCQEHESVLTEEKELEKAVDLNSCFDLY